MNWEHVRRRFNGLAHRAWRRRPVLAPRTIDGLSTDLLTIPSSDETCRGAAGDGHEVGKVQTWRRRGLQRKGAHLRIAMEASAEEYSLAMLDEAGIVVSWYDRAFIGNMIVDDVVDDHVCQFYVLKDVAAGVPHRDLRAAVANGTCTEHGWRRRAGGSVYWGTTVIRALVNRNGQLQGFSHLTRQSRAPRKIAHAANRATMQRRELTACGPLQEGASGVLLQGMRS